MAVQEMKKQISLADVEYSNRKKKTKRDEFLEIMDEIIPWDEWVRLIVPHYPDSGRGRPPRGIETMLRMYLLQNWFNLSDEAVEDSIYDSYAMRNFMKINFFEEQAPDSTTLCKFRTLLNENKLSDAFSDAISSNLEKHGRIMRGGTIVDATIFNAPSSTKNSTGKRDPEMHQTKKGGEWYFGMKLHIGVDAGTGYVHSMEVTAANSSDIGMAHKLLREDDEVMYGDAGYTGIENRKEIKEDELLSKIDYRTNKQKPYRKNTWISGPGIFWNNYFEYQKSRVRSKVEYVFLVIKRIFGCKKARYRGLEKNRCQMQMLVTLANIYMCSRSGGFLRTQ